MILWFCLYAQFQPQTNFNTEVGQYCWGKTKTKQTPNKQNKKTHTKTQAADTPDNTMFQKTHTIWQADLSFYMLSREVKFLKV